MRKKITILILIACIAVAMPTQAQRNGKAKKQQRKAMTITNLPYANSFDTEDEQNAFTIVDANNDGSTWDWISNSEGNSYARYSYSAENDADDWLFSPAIRLEAGKTYRVAFDTRHYDDDERIEMLMGTAATAEAMTVSVIEPTDVTWSTDQTLENKQLTVTTTGNYYFGIHAISPANHYRLYADNFNVEEIDMTAPGPVTDFVVEPFEDELMADIKFKAPTTRLNGDPFTGIVPCIQLFRDGEVIEQWDNIVQAGEQCTFTDERDNLTIGSHTYKVATLNANGQAQWSEPITVMISGTLYIPFNADFTKEQTASMFTIIDANNDESTWGWESGYWMSYHYNAENAGDDYLITPRLHLESGKTYQLVVNALTSGYTERFEALLGEQPTVEALTTVLIEPTEVEDYSNEGTFYETYFTVPTDGTYHVAIHAISDADMDHLTLNSMSVIDGPKPLAPAKPTLKVTADAEGEPKASIEVITSAFAFGGTMLDKNINVKIERDGEIVGTIENVIPGTIGRYNDEVTEHGYHTYRAIPYNDEGDGDKSDRVNIFIGMDIPMEIENLTATDQHNSVKLQWDKVGNVGKNELYVNPEKVDYNVWTTKFEEGFFGPELIYDEKLATLRDADTYNVEINTSEGNQGYLFWVVEAETEAGTGDNAVTGLLVGTPYQLPMTEGFANSETHYFWESNGSMQVSTIASDEDGYALALLGAEEGELYVYSGKIDLASTNQPVLTFDVKAQGIEELDIVDCYDVVNPVNIHTAAMTEEYETIEVDLAALKNRPYARIGFRTLSNQPSTFDWWTGELIEMGTVIQIDNIRIYDVASGITTIPAEQQQGKTYTLDGRRVNNNDTIIQKGIYIKNGKKVVIK